MKNNFRIKVTKDGPYVISGKIPLAKEKIVPDKKGDPLEWHKIEDFPEKEGYALCRCGNSSNKPYCDGSHIKTKFKGAETADNDKYNTRAKKIDGPDLILRDLPELCVHARFCDRAGGIWDLTAKSNDSNAKKIAIQEACNCPSGRLVIIDKKTGREIEPDFKESISLVEDQKAGVSGPLWIKGRIPIESADGSTYEFRNRATLCRCGKSKNKPFCDGTHISIGFQDKG